MQDLQITPFRVGATLFMNYIAFNFETISTDQSEQLIALLSEQQFEGFEESGNILKAFIAEALFSETVIDTISKLFPSLVYTRCFVENINWNEQWEQSFQPVIINDFAAIRATFHQPVTMVQHEIIITPKMSFGTGHHATTYLMVQQMQSIDFKGKKVLDFGTGTGVLAILAEKLGAASVFAVDNDEWSILNTVENIGENNCHKITVEQHNAIPIVQNYDIILANINLNVIKANLSSVVLVSETGCTIVLSGFLKENEIVIEDGITKAGLKYISTTQRGEWIAVMAQR
jgi:ribosomal protein L11 methyltransferase